MDMLKLNSLRERLKTQGAQMGRIVSTKMKDLLQSSTPESKMVDEATSENLPEPNWGMNMRICAMINSQEFRGTEVMRVIKKKLSSKNEPVQRLSLDLLEACAMNCEKAFSEIALEKVLDVMVRIIEVPEGSIGIRRRAWELIRAWGELRDLDYLPVFRQTYMNLNMRRTSSPLEDGRSVPLDYLSGSNFNHQPPTPPGEYHSGYDSSSAYDYGSFSVEQKREFIVVTRNSLDLLLSILNSETKPSEDELSTSMLEKCKEALPVIQLIIESTVEDDGMLFEALSLHDEIQRVIAKCEEVESASEATKVVDVMSYGSSGSSGMKSDSPSGLRTASVLGEKNGDETRVMDSPKTI